MSTPIPDQRRHAGFGIAYTSYVVRMLQGGDIFTTTGVALPAERFIALCVEAGASGCQLDLTQLGSTEPAALAGVRDLAERHGLFLELSVPGRWFESPEAFEHAAGIAHALGVRHLRVGLLYGRRYESFESMAAWQEFVAHWHAVIPRCRPAIERHGLLVGIENHKDWLADELAAWLRALDSPCIGVCLDFGNNLALLEDPMATVETLAPFAVTTHLKDMAVQVVEDGFLLSEVPLGSGLLALDAMVDVVRRARPDIHFCLEMLTRDPLAVPYRHERYWMTRGRPDERALERFASDVLAKAWERLPGVTGLAPAAALAAEDENVRRSVRYARDELGL